MAQGLCLAIFLPSLLMCLGECLTVSSWLVPVAFGDLQVDPAGKPIILHRSEHNILLSTQHFAGVTLLLNQMIYFLYKVIQMWTEKVLDHVRGIQHSSLLALTLWQKINIICTLFFPMLENILKNIVAFSFSLSQPPSLFFFSFCLIPNAVLMKVLLPVKQWLYLFNEPVPMCCLIASLFPLLVLWITKLLVFD